MDNRTHGAWRTPEYRIWRGIINRTRPEAKDSKNYSERGIVMCARWKMSFEAFLEDMGKRPSPEYSIDRKDNAGPYSPDNCRWATRSEQQRNTRRNSFFAIRGETKSIAEWADWFGIPWATMYSRVKRGWTEDRFPTKNA